MKQMARYAPFLDCKTTVKMTILPKEIYKFNAISVELPMAFFTELEQKKFFNLYRNTNDPEISKAI